MESRWELDESGPGYGRIRNEAPRTAVAYEDSGLIESRNVLNRKI
jgi:hypothetical protein